MAIPDVLDALEREHARFRQLAAVPDHIFARVEDGIHRLKQQAWSNQHHSSRMERQTKNIQKMVC